MMEVSKEFCNFLSGNFNNELRLKVMHAVDQCCLQDFSTKLLKLHISVNARVALSKEVDPFLKQP